MLPNMEVYAVRELFDLTIGIRMKSLVKMKTWLKRRQEGRFEGECLRLMCSLSREGSFLVDWMLCTSFSPLPMTKID